MSVVHLISPFCRLTPRTGNFTATKTEESKPNSQVEELHLVYDFFKKKFPEDSAFCHFFLLNTPCIKALQVYIPAS